MSLKINCPTDHAIFLFGVPMADNGVFLFPSTQAQLPGLHIHVSHGIPIHIQLVELVQNEIGQDIKPSEIHIFQEFAEQVQYEGKSFTLYTGFTKEKRKIPLLHWHTLPDILRKMGKHRHRLSYLKAWQVQTGALEQNVRAVEMDDKELDELVKERSQSKEEV